MTSDRNDSTGPPRLAEVWLAFFCAPALLEEIQGDLHELFDERLRRHGRLRARLHYWWDVLWFFRPYVLRRESPFEQARGPIMWKNYLKIAFRSLRKYKGTSFINVSGLAIGMACCLVVLVFVRDELSYDRYHEHEDRLYRLAVHAFMLSSGEDFPSATSPILWGPALQRDYPEVAAYTRFVGLASPNNPWTLSYRDQEFTEENILYADPSAFDLFSWPLLQGDPEAALAEPQSIVLTEKMAAKYFGRDDPLGKTLRLDPRLRDNDGALTGETFDYTVTGVLKNIPRRSHFTFDFLLPSSGLNAIYGGDINTGAEMNNWFWRGRIAHTYLLLQEDADPRAFETKFDAFLDRYIGEDTRSRGYYYEPYLQRIDQIYLDGNLGGQLQDVGDVTNVTMFSIIAAFILLIACINFMNLSTARSIGRAKEVGMRKVVGAYRKQLVTQFLGESVLISLISFVLALGLAWLMLPLFYGYLNKEFALDYSQELIFLLSLLGVGLFVGIFAGSYPAFVLSRFKPAAVLKGVFGGRARGSAFRKGLVVFQFAISAILIIATLTVFKQLNFMRSYELGFDRERVLVTPPTVARSLMPQYEAFREELLSNPQIADVAAASGVPGQGGGGDIYVAKGSPAEDGFGLGEVFVDYNYVEMFGLNLIAGRDFSREIGTDAGVREDGRFVELAAIVNEEAVRQFGWESPEAALGQQIIRDPNAVDWTANVIGVMEDFHFQSLRQPIGPVALLLYPRYSYVSVKFEPGNIPEAVAFVEEQAAVFAPEAAFAYSFLDEAFAEQYEAEERLGEVFSYVAFLAIFIACLGLFGLAAFTAERRTKEIGVRKVLGASLADIVVLLSKGFALLVLIAFVVAAPLAYFAVDSWLEDFAYRIDVGVDIFVLAGLLAFAIAILTISYQAIKAALADPVESLRHE